MIKLLRKLFTRQPQLNLVEWKPSKGEHAACRDRLVEGI